MAKRLRMVDTSVPEHEVEVGPSRTEKRIERKGKMSRLEKMGDRLTTVSEKVMARLELDRETVIEVHRLADMGSGHALSRQRRRVARMLQEYDIDVLERRVDDAEGTTILGRAPAHRLERLRRELLKGDAQTLSQLFEDYPEIDRQRLGQAVRAAQKEAAAGEDIRRFKELFKLMKSMGLGQPPQNSQPA